MVGISNLDKAQVLAALYDASKPLGMGLLHFDPAPMSLTEASLLLDGSNSKYFGYVKGRVMKVDLSKSEFDPRLYDRDNGQGAAQAVIDKLNAHS